MQPTDAGNYRVVVTNSAGSVTNSSALLTVRPIISVRRGGNNEVLSWSGSQYTLQAASPVPTRSSAELPSWRVGSLK